MSKNTLRKFLALLLGTACVATFAAVGCGGDETPPDDEKDPPVVQTKTYTVTFNANGGTLTGEATYEIEVGTSIISGGPEATRDGYKFDGWYDNADCEGTEVVPDFDYFEEDTTLSHERENNPFVRG